MFGPSSGRSVNISIGYSVTYLHVKDRQCSSCSCDKEHAVCVGIFVFGGVVESEDLILYSELAIKPEENE